MATDEHLPRVLLIRKPKFFTLFGEESFTSKKFQFLKAYDSTLPLHQFLTTDADAKSVQAIFSTAPVTADILQLLPMVRLVVATSAGLNHIDLAECRRLGVAVANSGTVFSEDVADVAVGLLIDVFRKMSAASRYVRQGLWLAKGDYPLGSKVYSFSSFSYFNYIYFCYCLNRYSRGCLKQVLDFVSLTYLPLKEGIKPYGFTFKRRGHYVYVA